MSLSTTYTKTETDFLIQQLEIKTSSGYQGDLLKTDAAPTTKGFYALLETGIYTNLGNINAEAGKLNFASFDGTTWSKVEVDVVEVFNNAIIKKDLTTLSVNLFDKNNVRNGFYIDWESGNEYPINDYSSTDFVKIQPNEDYSSLMKFQIAFFDENKNYISGIASPETFKTPLNAYYYRMGVPNSELNKYSLVKGTIKKIVSPNVVGLDYGVSANKVANIDLFGLEKNFNNANLFSDTNIVKGTYIDSSTGLMAGGVSNDYYSTLPIRIKGGATYEFGNTQNQQYAYYDKYFNYLGGYAALSVNEQSKRITFPYNAEYLSFTGVVGVSQSLIEVNGNKFDKYLVLNNSYIDYNSGQIGVANGYSATKLIPIKPNVIYEFGSVEMQQLAFFDESKNYISGHLGSSSGNLKQIKSPNGAFYISFTMLTKNVESQYFIEVTEDKQIEYIELTAVKNTNNWCSIRNLAESINDASYFKRYIIKVPIGTWNEIDWLGWGDYIQLVGESRFGTIINLKGDDANPDFIAPPNYMGNGGYDGQQIATIPQIYKHIVFAYRNLNVSNMSFTASYCKYTIHIDNPNFENVKFYNCSFIEENNSCVVGMGIWGGQNILFENCSLKRLSSAFDRVVFYHNWTNQVKPSKTHFKGCSFENGYYIVMDELQSTQSDLVIFENCKNNSAPNNTIITRAESADYLYNIQLIVTGTIATYYAEKRPLYENYSHL